MRTPCSWLRLSVCSVALVLVAGCGGGGGTGGGGNPPATVTFTFDGPAPTAVAAKFGSGAYTAQTLTAGTLTLTIPSGTSDFAVVYVCPPLPVTVAGVEVGQVTQQQVLEATVADGTSFTRACAQLPSGPQTGTLTGTVDASAIPGFSYVAVQAANGSSVASTEIFSVKSDFSFAAPVGTDRVEVLAYLSSPFGTLPVSSGLLAAKTYDSQTVPGSLNGGNAVVLSAADQTTAQPITYQNVPSGYNAPTTQVNFVERGNVGFPVADQATTTYPALPPGAVRSGDSYLFIATAHRSPVSGVPLGPAVVVAGSSTTGGPMTFAFPAPWTYTGPTPAALPAFDFVYSGFASKTGISREATLIWSAIEGNTTPSSFFFSISSTANYQGGSTTVMFPDLSFLTGFLPVPASGTSVSWAALTAQNGPQATTMTPAFTGVEATGGFTVP